MKSIIGIVLVAVFFSTGLAHATMTQEEIDSFCVSVSSLAGKFADLRDEGGTEIQHRMLVTRTGPAPIIRDMMTAIIHDVHNTYRYRPSEEVVPLILETCVERLSAKLEK